MQIRTASLDELRDVDFLCELIAKCGLVTPGMLINDKHPYPKYMEQFRSPEGFRMCQFPCQLAPYLIWLSDKEIKRYMEVGVWMGGTFIFTVEYLNRFTQIEHADAVDLEFRSTCPLGKRWYPFKPHITLTKMNTKSASFSKYMRTGKYDLVLIDGDHTAQGVRNDFNKVSNADVRYVGFHDICDHWNPGVVAVWNELKCKCDDSHSHEFVEQYKRSDKFTRFGLGILEMQDG